MGKLLPFKGTVRVHFFATQTAFHIGEAQTPLGKRIPWGRRASDGPPCCATAPVARSGNMAVSATPAFWPYLHFKLKARVLFAELASGNRAGAVIGDTAIQHRLRRTICKGWRNKQWHGRLMAYLELLAGECSHALPCRSPPLAPSRLIRGRSRSRRQSRPRCRTRWKTTRRKPTTPRSACSTRREETDGTA
jgi:hypothetical protein